MEIRIDFMVQGYGGEDVKTVNTISKILEGFNFKIEDRPKGKGKYEEGIILTDESSIERRI